MSWIHIHDLVALIAFLMKESTVRGVFNATSPFPVTNREFTQALAEAVHRPAILPVPAFALKMDVRRNVGGAAGQPAGFSRRRAARGLRFSASGHLRGTGSACRRSVIESTHVREQTLALLALAWRMAQDAPRLPLEQVPLNSVGTVSSVAMDRSGVIYVLQRGDKADPVIAVDKQGKTLRSWGKGMFTVPHSVRVDADGNVWTVDAGSSTILKFTPQGKKLQEISVGEIATGDKCAFLRPCAAPPTSPSAPTDGCSSPMATATRAFWNTRRRQAREGVGQRRNRAGAVSNPAWDRLRRELSTWPTGELPRPALRSGRKVSGRVDQPRPPVCAKGDRRRAVGVDDVDETRQILKVDLATGKILGQIEAPGPHSIDVTEAGEVSQAAAAADRTQRLFVV